MSSIASVTAAASATASASAKVASQGGIFEGLNPAKFNASNPIILFIIQAAIVIGLCRGLYWPLGKIRQPPVIAEVLAVSFKPSLNSRKSLTIPGSHSWTFCHGAHTELHKQHIS